MDGERYVTWDVHHEFEKRMAAENQRRDDENTRQNHRIEALETTVKEIGKLTTSVEKLAMSTQNMATELSKQGDRLTEIEKKPGKRWESVVTAILGAVAGAVGAGIAAGIIH